MIKKILHVVNVPFVIPYFFGNQIYFFNNLGFEVHIACTNHEKLKLYSSKYNFIAFPLEISRRILPITDMISIFKLYRYLRVNNIDIVVGHTPKGALIAMVASFFARCSKRIYFCHGLMFETSFGLVRKLYLVIEKLTTFLSTSVICVSNSVKYNSIGYNLGPPHKFKVIKSGSCNGIDSYTTYNPDLISHLDVFDLKKRLLINDNDKVVGFIGRLATDKGVNELISAWIDLIVVHDNYKLVLCGPIDDRDPINLEILEKINSEPSIIYVGEIDNPFLYYTIFDVFILPSYREGLPTVNLEASSMRLPIITSKSTGCIDSIIEGHTGVFCEINSHSIAHKIEFYLENFSIASLHGKQGRQNILNNFDQKEFWLELSKIYSDE